MFDFDKHLADLAGQTVLCIGDLMLDEFVYGEVSRISPEAPTPVIACKRSELMAGGAGNVARNLNLARRALHRSSAWSARTTAAACSSRRWPTMPSIDIKARCRCIAGHHAQGALRLRALLDPSVARRLGDARRPSIPLTEEMLIARALSALPRAGAVVLSDYAKGALTPRVIRAVIDAAKSSASR